MSSRNSSMGSGSHRSGQSTVVVSETFRSSKADGYLGTRIERETANGKRNVTYNHNAGRIDEGAPRPTYEHASYGGGSRHSSSQGSR